MLRRCLDHIRKMLEKRDASINSTVIVVDNDPDASASAIFEEAGLSGIYVHEPRRGITMARNSAIEQALAIKADLLAFVDDDGWPDKDWLANMVMIQRATQAEVVRGRKYLVYPDPIPFWVTARKKDPFGPKTRVRPVNERYVSAGDVLISAKIVRDLGLRFDHRFALSSGEDTEFFTRAARKGAALVASDLPLMFEEVVPERCTYWRQVRRQYQYATGNTMVDMDEGKFLSVVAEAFGRFMNGAFNFVQMPILGLSGLRRFKRCAVKGGSKIMYAAGQIAVLCGYRYQAYKNTEGY